VEVQRAVIYFGALHLPLLVGRLQGYQYFAALRLPGLLPHRLSKSPFQQFFKKNQGFAEKKRGKKELFFNKIRFLKGFLTAKNP